MRARLLRLATVSAAASLPIALAGCYTVFSHAPEPLADADAGANESLRSPIDNRWSTHALDAIGGAWNALDGGRGFDPRLPSAYANWLGYLPEPWLDYYRDPAWRDPWFDPRVIAISDGTPTSGDDRAPIETGGRHLWQRRGLASGGGGATTQVTGPANGGQAADSAGGGPSPNSQVAGSTATPAPPTPVLQPEKGSRHLWGRPPR